MEPRKIDTGGKKGKTGEKKGLSTHYEETSASVSVVPREVRSHRSRRKGVQYLKKRGNSIKDLTNELRLQRDNNEQMKKKAI